MTQHAEVRIGPQGRVVIPARLRDELHLGQGEVLVAHVEGDRLVFERRQAVIDRLRRAFGAAVPRTASLVDELIADRRAEAARENKD
jgi:AbrB family looped-hinge helix DNA binding protein